VPTVSAIAEKLQALDQEAVAADRERRQLGDAAHVPNQRIRDPEPPGQRREDLAAELGTRLSVLDCGDATQAAGTASISASWN
jgi:hypothetical protein